MKIDLNELKKRSEFISCKEHPKLPLLIWNYTHKCQYSKAWDNFTKLTRGLITDKEGNVIQRPFSKFFNLGETEESKEEKVLTLGTPRIFEKLDGSLGIQYYDGDIPQIATRGSFTSDQAKWASEWISTRFNKEDFLDGYTYLYEIIYPQNRIVVDYQDRAELVLLAVVDVETGAEINYISEAKKLGIAYAEVFEGLFAEAKLKMELNEVTNTPIINEEGYVMLYPNGLRVKMKSKEYCRIHKLLSGLSSKSIWECLRETGALPELDYRLLPIPIIHWMEDIKYSLERKVNNKAELVLNIVKAINKNPELITRKDKALYILQEFKEEAPYVFAKLDKKDFMDLIWRDVEPPYATPVSREQDLYEPDPPIVSPPYPPRYPIRVPSTPRDQLLNQAIDRAITSGSFTINPNSAGLTLN